MRHNYVLPAFAYASLKRKTYRPGSSFWRKRADVRRAHPLPCQFLALPRETTIYLPLMEFVVAFE